MTRICLVKSKKGIIHHTVGIYTQGLSGTACYRLVTGTMIVGPKEDVTCKGCLSTREKLFV